MTTNSSSDDDDNAAAGTKNSFKATPSTKLLVQSLRLERAKPSSSSSSSSASENGEESGRGQTNSKTGKRKRRKETRADSESDGGAERNRLSRDRQDDNTQSDNGDNGYYKSNGSAIDGGRKALTNPLLPGTNNDDSDDDDDGISAWRKSRLTSAVAKPKSQDEPNGDERNGVDETNDDEEDGAEPQTRRPNFSSPSSSSSSSPSEAEEAEAVEVSRPPLSFSFSEGPRAEAHARAISIWNSHYSGLGSLIHPFISIVETVSNYKVTFFCNMCQGASGKHDQPKNRQIREIKTHLLQRCSLRNVRNEEFDNVNTALRGLHRHYEEYVARGPRLRLARERSRQKQMQEAKRTLLKKAVAELFLVTELPRTRTNLQYVRSLSEDVLGLSNALDLKTMDVDEIDLVSVHKRMREL